MIEVPTESIPTLETVDELFDALSRLVGRTIMVRYSGQKGNDYVRATHPSKVVGRLEWLKLEDGDRIITLFMGKPLFGDRPKLPSVGLATKISVLADDVWTVVHEPKARQN